MYFPWLCQNFEWVQVFFMKYSDQLVIHASASRLEWIDSSLEIAEVHANGSMIVSSCDSGRP